MIEIMQGQEHLSFRELNKLMKKFAYFIVFFAASMIAIIFKYLSQNAKRASARKDTGLDQSLFSVQLFRLRINIIKVCKGSI